MMKRFGVLLLMLAALTAVSCASTPVSLSTIIPAEAQQTITAGCDTYTKDFKPNYQARRVEVIANREWLEELLPDVWRTLVYVDEHAAEIDTVVSLVCRLFAGEQVQGEIDRTRREMEGRGVDWPVLLEYATRLATMLIAQSVT